MHLCNCNTSGDILRERPVVMAISTTWDSSISKHLLTGLHRKLNFSPFISQSLCFFIIYARRETHTRTMLQILDAMIHFILSYK